jgi:hypothetical protein
MKYCIGILPVEHSEAQVAKQGVKLPPAKPTVNKYYYQGQRSHAKKQAQTKNISTQADFLITRSPLWLATFVPFCGDSCLL